MLRTRNLCVGIAGVALAAGLATTVDAGSDSSAVRAEASIINADGDLIGFAKFTQDGAGAVHVNIKVSGLAAGKHGVHIHETGSCGSTGGLFAEAGLHYSQSDGPHANHRGDLPNLVVSEGLQGHLNTTTDLVTLTDGPTTVFDAEPGKIGSSIVIHADEDDFGSVANGNSGARVACGVIVRI